MRSRMSSSRSLAPAIHTRRARAISCISAAPVALAAGRSTRSRLDTSPNSTRSTRSRSQSGRSLKTEWPTSDIGSPYASGHDEPHKRERTVPVDLARWQPVRQCGVVRFVLVHSPLVGPGTWRWVAEDLVEAGHEVAVPDLRAAAATGDPAAVVSAAVAVVGDAPVVIAGHSGAGSLLPSIAAGAEAQLVFVDAGVPPCSGPVGANAEFLEQLRSLSIGGVLPKWSTWWGEGAMEGLVPDEARRRQVVDELPQIPLAFYESSFTAPAGWCQMPASFVLLSEAYRADVDTARSRGWPVVERLGNHLDIVNRPSAVTSAIVEVTV